MTGNAALARAREAIARAEWDEAYRLLAEADAQSPLPPQDLELLAGMAYAAGHLDVTIATWERAYGESLRRDDRLGAAGAAVRVAMHLLFDTALMAPVRGWCRRVEQLLEGFEETPVHAWLAVVRNYERMLSGDFAQARIWARRAIAIGERLAPAAAAIGDVAEARSLILEGNVSEGLSLLNEAGVAAVSGELDPLSTGIVYCEVICALQALAQYDMAEEWTEAMERWRKGQPVGSIHGRCRVHRAEILRLRGAWNEAESEALLACQELRPYLRREFGWPLTELGRIRLRRGDVAGAEAAFVGAHEEGWDPQPGFAMLHLAQHNTELAAASIRDALEHPGNVPSKEVPPNSELRRAPLLEAQVEIAVAAGDLGTARAAAEQLARIGASYQSKAIAASAAVAIGRIALAEGDAVAARAHFERAIPLWTDVGAPYETALARMHLGEAYRAQGNETLAVREFRAVHSAFEQIGAAADALRAAQAAGDLPVTTAPSVAPVAPGNIFRREGDYWLVVFEKRTVRLRDLKGLRYLVRLFSDPGREFHALDLVAGESGVMFSDAGDAGEMLDERAKEAYRRRLAEIEQDLDEARAMNDAGRAARANEERDFLVRELARAIGLGGRDRRAASMSERARVSVTRSLRQAMARIREHDTALADHLDRTIRTGTYCSYQPDPRAPVAWQL